MDWKKVKLVKTTFLQIPAIQWIKKTYGKIQKIPVALYRIRDKINKPFELIGLDFVGAYYNCRGMLKIRKIKRLFPKLKFETNNFQWNSTLTYDVYLPEENNGALTFQKYYHRFCFLFDQKPKKHFGDITKRFWCCFSIPNGQHRVEIKLFQEHLENCEMEESVESVKIYKPVGLCKEVLES